MVATWRPKPVQIEPKAFQNRCSQASEDNVARKHYFSTKLCNKWNNVEPQFSPGFLHILLRASAPGSAYGGCPKALVFTTKKARFPSPGPPKSTQNRPQTHKNAKLEAKSRRKAISEALETDFEPQDSDF